MVRRMNKVQRTVQAVQANHRRIGERPADVAELINPCVDLRSRHARACRNTLNLRTRCRAFRLRLVHRIDKRRRIDASSDRSLIPLKLCLRVRQPVSRSFQRTTA